MGSVSSFFLDTLPFYFEVIFEGKDDKVMTYKVMAKTQEFFLKKAFIKLKNGQKNMWNLLDLL